ncbi:MAG: hypothetical protein ABFR75_00785 [Acidobacteriota bacterium]
MNELINIIPNPDPLPVASGWFHFLNYLTYYLHLISVGIMFSTAVSMTFGYFKAKSDPKWEAFAKQMSKILPFSIAFAVNLGVAPLLFIQVLYGNFFYAASILIGTVWILLIVFLILGYYGSYWLVFKKEKKNGSRKYMSIFISLVLAWTGFILVNINTLMMTPGRWKSYFSHMGGTFLNIGEPTLFSRYIFYLFFLMAIGGLFIAGFYKIKPEKSESKAGTAFGSTLSGYSSFLALPSFIIFMRTLPVNIRDTFFGGDLLWTGICVVFLLCMIATGYLSLQGKVTAASIILILNLIIFVVLRGHVRYLYLERFNEKISVMGHNTQYGVMVLFFVTLAAGLGLVFWILRKVYKEVKV